MRIKGELSLETLLFFCIYLLQINDYINNETRINTVALTIYKDKDNVILNPLKYKMFHC